MELTEKYDDASWHSGGDFPPDLPREAGAIHIGMFVAWAMLRGLGGDLHLERPEFLEMLMSRSTTPGAWFIDNCDEKLTNEDLNSEGNAFAADYYRVEAGGIMPVTYFTDYDETFPEYDPLYRAPDTWATFDRIAPVLDRRLREWRGKKSGPGSFLRRLFGRDPR